MFLSGSATWALSGQRWPHWVKSQMRSVIVVAFQKRLYLVGQFAQGVNTVFVLAQAFAANGAVETLNERLLVLLVRAGNPMLAAEVRSRNVKLGLTPIKPRTRCPHRSGSSE